MPSCQAGVGTHGGTFIRPFPGYSYVLFCQLLATIQMVSTWSGASHGLTVDMRCLIGRRQMQSFRKEQVDGAGITVCQATAAGGASGGLESLHRLTAGCRPSMCAKGLVQEAVADSCVQAARCLAAVWAVATCLLIFAHHGKLSAWPSLHLCIQRLPLEVLHVGLSVSTTSASSPRAPPLDCALCC